MRGDSPAGESRVQAIWTAALETEVKRRSVILVLVGVTVEPRRK